MITQGLVTLYKKELEAIGADVPTLHVVLGSGLASELGRVSRKDFNKCGEFPFSRLPGFEPTTVEGHSGQFHVFKHTSGRSVCFQSGRYHGYEGHSPHAAVRPVLMAAFAGTKEFLLTNAAGSLTKAFEPGSAMIIRDHVNFTGKNPLEGPNTYGPRFPDMSEAYDKNRSEALKVALKKQNVTVHEGVYIGLLGPSFETPAEVKLFGQWGLHAAGMSTVWEVIALKHAGASVAGFSLITNFGCGLTQEKLDHLRMMTEVSKQARVMVNGIFDYADGVLSGQRV